MEALSTVVQRADLMSASINALAVSTSSAVERLQSAFAMSLNVVIIERAGSAMALIGQEAQQAENNIEEAAASQESLNKSAEKGKSAFASLAEKIKNSVSKLDIGNKAKAIAADAFAGAKALEATQVRYQAAFGGMSGSADQFISDFCALTPVTTAEARNMAVGIQELLQPMGLSQSTATQMTGEYLQLAGALANMRGSNTTAQSATEAFQSALEGNYAGLKGLGIQADEAAVRQRAVEMGLAGSTDAVSQAAKAQALLQLATQQSSEALAAYNLNSLDTSTRMQLLKTGFQNAFAQAGQPALEQFNELLLRVQELMPKINEGIQWFGEAAGGVLDLAVAAMDNWGILEPIIFGVAVGISAYTVATKAAAVASQAAKIAMEMWSAAKQVLNAVMNANPIILTILAVIALIAIIYAVVGAINKFAGTTISATGIIAGAFALLGTHVINTFVIPLWNMIAAFINFLYNVWNDPIAAVKILFLDLASTVIGYIANMAHAIEDVINHIPGVEVDITSGIDTFQQQIEGMAANVKTESEWKEIVKSKEFIDYGEAAKTGYQAGQKAEDKVKNAFEEISGFFNGDMTGLWESIGQNTENTASNTASMGDSMNMAEEDLAYMRELAEQETINRFTTAEIRVDMVNNNSISSNMDLDGIVNYVATGVHTAMQNAAEGVHV